MDSTDDDFGELYVDDKVQAFAGDVGFVKPCEEPKCSPISDESKCFEGTIKPESRGEKKKLGVVAKDSSPSCVDACDSNRTDANEESEYSDSDDDLNIVLKDDGSKVLPIACGSNTNNGGESSQTCSFQKRKTRNWCTMSNSGMVNGRMTTMEASANNAWMNPSLGMPQCGYNFSHTWSRTASDANSHVFEKKPWRNPGTDITDFFNFGFNEQSWKEYCKPLGRAIEVQGGTLGRIPSVDLRHPPRDSDPDVVIQIPVTNDVKELASGTPVEASSLGITSDKASTSEEFHSDNGNDLSSPGDSMKEEASVGCEDENTGSFRGEQSSPKENCCSREVTPCDKKIIEEEKDETCWNSNEADSTSVERESSLGDHFRLSPTSSYSVGKTEGSETESSKGGTTDDQREVSTPPRRTSLAENEANNIKSGEGNGTKHSRHRRSHENPSKRHCGRADYGVHRRTKHGIVKDPDLGERVCSGRGSLYRDSSKNWQNGPPFTLEKVETEGKGFPHSNREKRYGRSYSSVHLDRDREHMFGWCNNKETTHGRGFDHSNGYKYEEARLKEYTSRSFVNLNHRDSRISFNEVEDRYGRQHCERKYGRERSPDLAYESNKERNRYDWRREPFHQDRVPITDMDYRYRFVYSSAHGRHNPKQSRENDLHCRRRGDYDYNFNHHRCEDGVHRAESGIPFELDHREMHSSTEVGRWEFEIYEEFSEIDRRHHYTREWHLDRFVSEKDGYQYRIQDVWPSPSSSRRDSWYTKGSRGDPCRDDTRDFTTTEAYERQKNQLYKEAPRDGWTRNLVHSNNVRIQDRLRYDDDRVRRDRRRYKLGDDIQCSMREVTHSEHPSYTDEMLARDIRMSTKQGPGYFKRQNHEIDERHNRYKKLRRDGHAFVKCKDPVDLIGRQGKLSEQSGRRFSNGRDPMEQQERQKPGNVSGRKKEEAGVENQGLDEKEEGEIIEEVRNVKGIEIGEERIQESLKKMEKRRERFKKTEFSKTVEATVQSQTKPGAQTDDDTNQERPVRKRRWLAS